MAAVHLIRSRWPTVGAVTALPLALSPAFQPPQSLERLQRTGDDDVNASFSSRQIDPAVVRSFFSGTLYIIYTHTHTHTHTHTRTHNTHTHAHTYKKGGDGGSPGGGGRRGGGAGGRHGRKEELKALLS